MNTVPRSEPTAAAPPPFDAAARGDAASLEEYLVEYLCRERISADEMQELLISEALLHRDR